MAKQEHLPAKFKFSSKRLRTTVLPTYENIIQAINFEIKSKTSEYSIKCVVKELILLWQKSSLPIVSKKTISDKVKKYYKEYLKVVHSKIFRLNYQSKVETFKVNKKTSYQTAELSKILANYSKLIFLDTGSETF